MHATEAAGATKMETNASRAVDMRILVSIDELAWRV